MNVCVFLPWVNCPVSLISCENTLWGYPILFYHFLVFFSVFILWTLSSSPDQPTHSSIHPILSIYTQKWVSSAHLLCFLMQLRCSLFVNHTWNLWAYFLYYSNDLIFPSHFFLFISQRFVSTTIMIVIMIVYYNTIVIVLIVQLCFSM
jgi:hypothetical protein